MAPPTFLIQMLGSLSSNSLPLITPINGGQILRRTIPLDQQLCTYSRHTGVVLQKLDLCELLSDDMVLAEKLDAHPVHANPWTSEK